MEMQIVKILVSNLVKIYENEKYNLKVKGYRSGVEHLTADQKHNLFRTLRF